MIYQLKMTLSDSRPPIWRRIEVEGSISLGQLHWVIQTSVNNMLKTLEKRGLISRVPRQPRSIKLLLLREELPDLE